jgi:hypothetical protein
MLISEGHHIVHIDSHSSLEDGKDVIAIDPDGVLCGYQLKAGNISKTRWREEVQGELRELVEFPTHHPSFYGKFCRPFLVTTGTLNENALHNLHMFNQSLPDRFERVTLIDRHDLLNRFATCNAPVMPVEPIDFKQFLDIMYCDGHEMLDKNRFSEFLDGLIDESTGQMRTGELRRRATGAMVLSSHALSAHANVSNHFATAEGWSLAACRIIRAAHSFGLSPTHWRQSVSLACDTAQHALDQLRLEALDREQLQEGDVLGDGGPVWCARMTVLCGALAASQLLHQANGTIPDDVNETRQFIRDNWKSMTVWGESAFPYFLLIYLFMRGSSKDQIAAENMLCFSYLGGLANINGSNNASPGVPNPYYTAQQCLEFMTGLDPDVFGRDTFRGNSFTSLGCILLLRRAMRRQALNIIWHNVSRMSYSEMSVTDFADFLKYRSATGTMKSIFLPAPTGWNALEVDRKRRIAETSRMLPTEFLLDPRLPILFAMTHPHRLTAGFCAWLDEQVSRKA